VIGVGGCTASEKNLQAVVSTSPFPAPFEVEIGMVVGFKHRRLVGGGAVFDLQRVVGGRV